MTPDKAGGTPIMDAFAASCVTNQILINKKSNGRNEKANLQELEWMLAVEQGRRIELALQERTAEVERVKALHTGLMTEADKRYANLLACWQEEQQHARAAEQRASTAEQQLATVRADIKDILLRYENRDISAHHVIEVIRDSLLPPRKGEG